MITIYITGCMVAFGMTLVHCMSIKGDYKIITRLITALMFSLGSWVTVGAQLHKLFHK